MSRQKLTRERLRRIIREEKAKLEESSSMDKGLAQSIQRGLEEPLRKVEDLEQNTSARVGGRAEAAAKQARSYIVQAREALEKVTYELNNR